MKLYSYFRSSASYRVRIALAMKGLPFQYEAVHLLKDGGQQLSLDVGFGSLEVGLKSEKSVGDFAFGDAPIVADIRLAPQVWNARRFDIPLDRYPTINRIANNAMGLEAFKQAEPSAQPDAAG